MEGSRWVGWGWASVKTTGVSQPPLLELRKGGLPRDCELTKLHSYLRTFIKLFNACILSMYHVPVYGARCQDIVGNQTDPARLPSQSWEFRFSSCFICMTCPSPVDIWVCTSLIHINLLMSENWIFHFVETQTRISFPLLLVACFIVFREECFENWV